MAIVSSAESHALIRKLWPGLPDHDIHGKQYARISAWILDEASIIKFHPNSVVGAFHDVVGIVDELRHYRSLSRNDALSAVKARFSRRLPSDQDVLRSTDLAVRLWLTLNVQSTLDPHSPGNLSKPYLRPIIWDGEDSLEATIENHFGLNLAPSTPGISQKVSHQLTAAYLSKNYGWRIVWTANLADHLVIDSRTKTIIIYEHKICLWNHLRFPHYTLLPRSIVEEAMDTLNLLFPLHDSATEKFLKKHGKSFYGLGLCGRQRNLDLSDYRYWRDAVAQLAELLEGPPIGVHQLKLDEDRRNTLQVATFWIAAFVAVLTIMGFVFGILAVLYSKKQVDIALDQYQLQIAQACATHEDARLLPKFCS